MTESFNPVSWFEIPVLDMKRAMAFYSGVFGVTLEEKAMGPSRMAFFPRHDGAAGASGSLLQEEGAQPSSDGSILYFEVADIARTLALVEAQGGAILLPRTEIGPFGVVAQFRDSEGNRVALHSN